MQSDNDRRAERYENEAAKIRREAEAVSDRISRETLLTIALQYENLAKSVRRLARKA